MNNRMILPKWTCEQCATIFERKRNGSKLPRFCSVACSTLWKKENNITAGQFKKGSIPWNKDMKGLRMSPETEFKKGNVPATILPVGTLTIRTRKRDSHKIVWIKIAEPNVWKKQAHIIWEEHNEPVPEGFVLHRIDGNSRNDDITNLMILSRAEHIVLHRPEFEDRRREACSVAQKARWKEYRESQYDSYYWQM